MTVPYSHSERRPKSGIKLMVVVLVTVVTLLVTVLSRRPIVGVWAGNISADGNSTGVSRPVRSVDASFHKKYEIAHRHENLSIAERLYNKVHILCWVMTHPGNHRSKADHIKATWGKRCNILLFMSTEDDPILPTVKLPVREGFDHLWAKTKAAFRYVYRYYRDRAHWFMKADDDTYVIMENLRLLLTNYSKDEPLLFGNRVNHRVPGGYMSGGAGYVLSREALFRFIQTSMPNRTLCNDADSGPEDLHITCCLTNVNVKRADSRDMYGRTRFFPGTPQAHFSPAKVPRYGRKDFYKMKQGIAYASDYPISFRNVEPPQLYLLDFLLYHLRPYGMRIKPYSVRTGGLKQEDIKYFNDNSSVITKLEKYTLPLDCLHIS